MILTSVLKDLLRKRDPASPASSSSATAGGSAATESPCVLNVGGGSKKIAIPDHYRGYRHLLLDIDPTHAPDVVCDARELATLGVDRFDAIYCSHNLEHYYKHDGARVLAGFLHVLKPEGFTEIRVPDLTSVMKHTIATGIDVEDELYMSQAGPITVRDVLYGWGQQIEKSGNDFYAHKTGFTAKSLRAAISAAGFAVVTVVERPELFELRAVAFKRQPSEQLRTKLGV